ncbi:CAIB/BAIF family protein [Burkholderia pseudomallei]|nr:CAIB/BAIF family protein [Burkholderia pseudomallei]
MERRWKRRPAGANWGEFGDDDQKGRLNWLTERKVLEGMAEVKAGKVFSLSLPLDVPRGGGLNARRQPPRVMAAQAGGRPYFGYRADESARNATDVVCDEHAGELDAIVGAFVAARDLADNLAFFEKTGVTVGPILDIAQIVQDHYVIEREALVELPDDDVGSLPMHGVVPRLSGTPGGFRRAAPKLGEHNREILLPLLGAHEYARLARNGVIRPE